MKKHVILCVDDEKIVLNSLKEQLRGSIGRGYSIETSDNAGDALELLEELYNEDVEVPLVISDYIMPGMKGDELLIKVHSLYPKIIKILLTGQATLEGVTSAINNAHLYRYIAKPWERDDLNLAVLEAIRSFEMDRKIEEQNSLLKEQNHELLVWTDAFVEAMGTTLDTRDTTTGGHSKRLAEYSVKVAKAINKVDYGNYKNFTFTEDEIKELHYSALLHDIGKIGVRESILLKEERLSKNRLFALKYKFKLYKTLMELKKLKSEITEAELFIMNNISLYLDKIKLISKSNYLEDEDLKLLDMLAKISFQDLEGEVTYLLDKFEFDNLSIKKGNLTKVEREGINYHAELTYNILKGIPWPKHLESIPEIASSHHEKLDGSGYFRGLKGGFISTQAKILAILDIYEALTAPDRPYKAPLSPKVAIDILKEDVAKGYLDGDILEIFINEKVYE